MHRGWYPEEGMGNAVPLHPTSFVYIHLADRYTKIARKYMSALPNKYSATVASTVATHST